MQSFDYVIVGAGAAGCVLAYRLSEDSAISVALLEAGPDHGHPLITMPKGVGKLIGNPRYTWAFPTEPEAGTAGTSEIWARGKVLGGSSAVNGLMYVRGMPEDFDGIAAQSSDDWSWRHIGAAYRALEHHELGPADTRGGSGPLRLSLTAVRDRLSEAAIAAGEQLGLRRKDDVNAPDGGETIGYAACTIYQGRRQSAATAFIDPVRGRPNLCVITNATVDRVLFEQRRAVAVSACVNGKPARIAARREVIVAGGALSSPGILQRSGIGPAELLRGLGIEVVHDSPQVGRNLVEHRAILMQWKLREPLSQNPDYAGWRLLRRTAEYFLRRTGPMAAGAYELGAWFKSRPELARPDIQFLIAPFSFDLAAQRQRLEPFHGMHIVAYPLRPTSRGEIHIRSTDPLQAPRLRPNYRDTAEDRATMVATVETARRWASAAPLRELIESETYPGPEATSAEQILAAYDRYGSCGYHAVGSCRMGADSGSVVDPQLRVRGVEGLRVMDTSIMPQIPSGNTNAPTMAMAWRAADLILRDADTAIQSKDHTAKSRIAA